MTDRELTALQGLVNDLCVLLCGWSTNEEHATFLAAQARVRAQRDSMMRLAEVQRLKQRLAELEQKDD